MLKNKDKIIL